MSTPHQGPGMYPQNDQQAALAWLASLDQNQQVALRRSIQTHQALAPIYNAVNRVVQVVRQTAARLSDYAQRLASSVRQFGQSTATRAGEVRQATTNRATEIGQNTANRVGEVRQAVTEFGQNTVARATELGQQATDLGRRGVEGVTAAGQQAADLGRRGAEAVVGAGRTAVAATAGFGQRVAEGGRQAVASVSRWVQEQRTNATTRAQAAGAAYQAFRHDPTLSQSGMSQKEVLELGQKFHALVTAQNPEERAAAAQQLVQAAEGLKTPNQPAQPQTPGQQTPGQPGQEAQEPGTGRHRAEDPAWALQGTAPASQAVATKPGGQQSETATTGQGKPRETGHEL
ncbi:hypothetical protein [Kribbella sp. VKM Ac-2568]|uniref:hypothetical protein n=1 Tax=Kribbella sp. VKM Ac-2568 TaxID=2512219 RepID=UPI0010472D9F|nr:hypothetical protein [Kribbella sp. VKM Ac-2568]TCM47814.1 hypothetical protein EV648_104208 [Kribbella sp. VKM Ac-2568]